MTLAAAVSRRNGGARLTVATLVAALAGIAVSLSQAPLVAVAVAAGISFAVIVAAIPLAGPAAWLIVGPLIVGIARGGGLAVLRPNEGLLLIAAIGVGAHALWRFSRGERVLPAMVPVDAAVALVAIAGSLVPLLLRYGRDLPLSLDDVLYALVFMKYLVLYALFRVAVRTPADVALCLKLALVAGAVVAVVAIFQVLGLFNVAGLLDAWYDAPFEGAVGPSSLRASSTIASSFGLADMMAMCLAITLAWLAKGGGNRPLLVLAGCLYLAGAAAAGSFSGFLGCAVAVVAAGLMTGRLLAIGATGLPAVAIAAAVFWPVLSARLAGFDSRLMLPRSWLGRLENLQRFFWPDLFSGINWLAGVRPAARVAAPETWRQWVYIESGYTWLLWVGGIPLLLAYGLFTWIAARDLFRIAKADAGPVGIAATAGLAATAMIFVLMVFDPHLTVRGSADLFFPLLALALVKNSERARAD